ncbi:E3 ubiquitin-protein ligase MGRN1 [Parasteatoda tepidariorum]|uniref:E3 ubiquitin-protein ligase MGRN1 n=1 Tax=Parasteatoda tepidariorum TaxID=114398 RepID=UPI00077FBF62|nr:E3 ubiquitin-protein ligase MGRN1 [Parasteatoda tepidariorum]
MGLIFSRQNARIEEIDAISNNAYRYPNKEGNYFANHFIMGGERFETTQPEAYLFGENFDLNFLGRKPTPFPYPAPQPNEPTKTLRSLINIRKESLRFLKVPDVPSAENQDTPPVSTSYNIEFTFDSDVRCAITIYYFCTEEITTNGVTYTPQDASHNSETYHYKKGVNQQFTQTDHVIDPSKYPEDMLSYKFEDEVIPILIQCVAEEGEDPKQQHMVLAIVEKNLDGSYTLKPLKQKLFVDGLCYLLQEIYGIENKNVPQTKNIVEEDLEDSGSECVICMSDARDTLILPCRHLCLCNSCADSLRYQANNCPICRAPFRALLQIRAVRKSNTPLPQISGDSQSTQDIPPGYELVSLIEALNGPVQPSAPLVPSFIPSTLPPFGNSPDMRHKHRYLDRNYSSCASRIGETSETEKSVSSCSKLSGNPEVSNIPEVLVTSMVPADKAPQKTESLSLTRVDVKKHRKGFRTSSAPEKMRLLTSSMETVNDGGKRKLDKYADAAETRSLLDSNFAEELSALAIGSSKSTQSCARSSPISLSTPHSLHLCEKSIKDTSPSGEDSDYYTPEDPSTTILVDQGTDTSLDTPHGTEPVKFSDSVPKTKNMERSKSSLEKNVAKSENSALDSALNGQSLVVKLEGISSLPGTPASNTSNYSGDSFSSTSSTRVLLRPQSCDTLPE